MATDFENLVLACKSLYTVAASLIEEHNKQRLKYRTLKLGNSDRSNAESYVWGQSVPEILYKIAQDPELARYIVDVELDNQQTIQRVLQYEEIEGFPGEGEEEPSEAGKAIRSLLQNSDYLSQINSSPEFVDEWLRRIMMQGDDEVDEDRVDYATLFFLTLLPNIETLTLGEHWFRTHSFETVLAPTEAERRSWAASDEISRSAPELMELIIKRANDETLQGQALAKLRTLNPTRDVDHQTGVEAIAAIPFLALNSMREFYHASGKALVNVKPERDYCCNFHIPGADDYQHDSGSDDGNEEVDEDEAGSKQNDEDQNEEDDEGGDDESNDEDEDNNDDDDDDDDCDSDSNEPRRKREDPTYHDRSDHFMHPKYPVLGRNVEQVILSDIVLFEDTCYTMFRDMKKLKRLEIHYSGKDEFGTEFDANGCITAIMYCVGATLDSLYISAGIIHPESTLLRQSMHDFKVLRHLELDTVFFVNSGGSVGPDFMEVDEDEDMSNNGPIEPLLYILPPCLQTFTLVVPCVDVESLPLLFENFAEERAEHLPNLKSVTLRIRRHDCWAQEFEDAETLAEQVVQFAQENGLEIEGDGESDDEAADVEDE